jgi:hypothetical protein
MLMASQHNLKFLIDAGLKDRLDAMLDAKNATLTGSMVNMIRWLLDQDDVVQSVLIGQLRPSPDLMKIVIERLASGVSSTHTGQKVEKLGVASIMATPARPANTEARSQSKPTDRTQASRPSK